EPAGFGRGGPAALPLQLRVAGKSSPSQPAPREFPPAAGNAGRSLGRRKLQPVRPPYLSHILLFSADVDAARPGGSRAGRKLQPVRPLYLSHILLFSADVDAARRFYEEVLGLRLS